MTLLQSPDVETLDTSDGSKVVYFGEHGLMITKGTQRISIPMRPHQYFYYMHRADNLFRLESIDLEAVIHEIGTKHNFSLDISELIKSYWRGFIHPIMSPDWVRLTRRLEGSWFELIHPLIGVKADGRPLNLTHIAVTRSKTRFIFAHTESHEMYRSIVRVSPGFDSNNLWKFNISVTDEYISGVQQVHDTAFSMYRENAQQAWVPII